MTLRYLNTAQQQATIKEGEDCREPVWKVRELLLNLPTSREEALHEDDASKAYAIVIEQLIKVVPHRQRYTQVEMLAQNLTRCFLPVIEKVKSYLRESKVRKKRKVD
jgi:hypothetical protein